MQTTILDPKKMEESQPSTSLATNIETVSENVSFMKNYLFRETDDYETLLEQEYQIESEENVKEVDKKPCRASKKIPPHLKALIGYSNILLAQGDYDIAEKMCFQIIKEDSSLSDPYLTLANISAIKEPQKVLDYYIYAAVCNPKDHNSWDRCGELLLKEGDINRAIVFFTNAVRCRPTEINLHLKRIRLLRIQNDHKNMLRSYVKMMKYITPAYSDYLIKLAEKIAREYHEMKEYKKAIEALNIPFQKCRSAIQPRIVNLMLELLILNKNYSDALDIFVLHCDITFTVVVSDTNEICIESYLMPDNIQIDLRIKFIICAIKLKSFDLLDSLLNPLLLIEDVDEIGDLFLDVVETLMESNRHGDALKLLVPLIKSKNYSLAAVWLKYGDCQNTCKLYEQAIESYRMVMQLAPLHIEVKYSLAEVLAKLNKKDEALVLLHQDHNLNELDVNLLILKIKLLKELEEYDDYFESLELLFSRHSETLRHFEEIRAVTFAEQPPEKYARLKKLRALRGESLSEKPTFLSNSDVDIATEYAILRDCLQLCMDLKRYATMQKFIFTALTSYKFRSKYVELGFMGFFASIFNRDCYHAFPLIRDVLIHYGKNQASWNLFNVLLQITDDLRGVSLMMRFLSSYPETFHSKFLEANYCLTIGNLKISLGYYLTQLRVNPTPLKSLLLGCVLIQAFGQKFTKNKEKVTKIAFTLFLKYSTTRSADAFEEINYNLGRLYQHFGLQHLASTYYKLVLNYESPLSVEYPNLSLKREAAYNLHLIYKNNKNFIAARNVLLKYNQV